MLLEPRKPKTTAFMMCVLPLVAKPLYLRCFLDNTYKNTRICAIFSMLPDEHKHSPYRHNSYCIACVRSSAILEK